VQTQKLSPVSGIKRALKQYNKISERQIVTYSVIFIFYFGRIASVWSPIVIVGEDWRLYDLQRFVAIKVHRSQHIGLTVPQ
jgi:cell division protein FtsI/penicillin-binding protein 2